MPRVKIGRAVTDPEKLVTPGILYSSAAGNGIAGHVLAFGWWDFHISFFWHTKNRENTNAD